MQVKVAPSPTSALSSLHCHLYTVTSTLTVAAGMVAVMMAVGIVVVGTVVEGKKRQNRSFERSVLST